MDTYSKFFFYLFFSFLLFGGFYSNAQNYNALEWEQQIKLITNDSSKLILLNRAAQDLIKSDLFSSKKFANEAINIASKLNNKKELADALVTIGKIEFYKGNYPKALDIYIKAQNLYTELQNKKGIADVYNLLATVNQYQGPANFYLTSNYNHQALKIQEKINDKEGLINSYFNLGELHFDFISKEYYNPDSSLLFFNKALELAISIDNKYILGNIYSSMGKTYIELKNYELAFNNLNKALQIHKVTNNKNGITFTNFRLAYAYSKVGDFNKAVWYDLKALKLAEEIKNLDLINNICEDLSGFFISLNDYKKALFYYRKSVETKFQLYSQERIAKIAEYQTKYETVKKEKEIILLYKYKEIQRLELIKKESELKKRQILDIAYICGIILVLILAIVAFRGYRNKKTANLLLAKQKNEILEKNSMLFQQKEEITSQRDEIEKKNTILKQAYDTIEIKNNKITSSINYALKIQQSILPTEENRNKIFPNSFILFLPKDIVSGDFYWIDKCDNIIFFAAVDCTGHGVPGAFMSMIAYNILDQALNEEKFTKPAEILNFLNTKLREKLHSELNEDFLRDGMDIALCAYNLDNKLLEYAGVHHPLYILRNKELLIYQPDIFNIGKNFTIDFSSFTNQTIQLEKNDAVYLFTDGFYDQFNETGNKKFTRKRFKDTLIKINDYDMQKQQHKLYEIYNDWKGNAEQIDDILVLGIKIL